MPSAVHQRPSVTFKATYCPECGIRVARGRGGVRVAMSQLLAWHLEWHRAEDDRIAHGLRE